MLVVDKNKEVISKKVRSKAGRTLRSKKFFFTLTLVGALAILFAINSAYFLYLGAKYHKEARIGATRLEIMDFIASNISLPKNYFKSFSAQPAALFIDLKFEHLQKIAYYKQLSLNNGTIKDEYKDESFPADIHIAGKPVKAKLNLAGAWLDHINSKKISMKVKLKDDQTFLGMKSFLLLNPTARWDIYEWIGHQLLRQQGLISLRYEFVDVHLNGVRAGTYVVEEGFDKRLLENNKRREGVIFKPTEPRIDVAKESSWLKSEKGRQQIKRAQLHLNALESGEIAPSKLVDVEAMAKLYAVTDLLNGYHSLNRINLRFYTNPITGKFEPIAREWNVHNHIKKNRFFFSGEYLGRSRPYLAAVGAPSVDLHRKILADEVIYKRYMHHLARMSEKKFLDDFFASIEPEMSRQLDILHRDYPQRKVGKKQFYEVQKRIDSILNNPEVDVTWQQEGEGVRLFFKNNHPLPVEVRTLAIGKQPHLQAQMPLLLPATGGEKTPAPASLFVPISQSVDDIADSIKVEVATSGIEPMTPKFIKASIALGPRMIAKNLDDIQLDANHSSFAYLDIDENRKIITFSQKNISIGDTLVIPKGFTLVAPPGTDINLLSGANLISWSPISFRGTKQSPVKIHSSDGKGGGILVIEAPGPSEMEHVHISGLSKVSSSLWGLVGSVNFYKAPVTLKYVHFANNHDADDILNIIASEFELQYCRFKNTYADAFDADFSKGRVSHTTFDTTGAKDGNGDGLDISGSELKLDQVEFVRVSDKALSIGEDSRLDAKGVTITNSSSGVVSKDKSHVTIDGLTLTNTSLGFAAYQKKPEYGPAHILVKNLIYKEVEQLHLLEPGSSLSLNGKLSAVSSGVDIRKKLYKRVN